MRHRSVYVDTAPRPAHAPPRGHTAPKTVRTSSMVVAGILMCLSLGLLLGGLFMSLRNSTRPLHSSMAREYKQHLKNWHHNHKSTFAPAEVTVLLNDEIRVPARLVSRPCKHSWHASPPTGDEGSPNVPDRLIPAWITSVVHTVLSTVLGRYRGEPDLHSQHVDFQAAGIMGKLSLPGKSDAVVFKPTKKPKVMTGDAVASATAHPATSAGDSDVDSDADLDDEEDDEEEEEELEDDVVMHAAPSKKDRHNTDLPPGKGRVTKAMLKTASFKLLIKSRRAASSDPELSTIDLGDHAFARLGNVSARSRRDCRNHQWGAWDLNAKRCNTVDYLAELCVKLKDEEGDNGPKYSLDHSHGGAGCYPKLHWRPEVWRRAKAKPLPHVPMDGEEEVPWDGSADVWEVVLPGPTALLAPRVVIRHARDPEVLERAMFNRLTREQQPLMAAHATGLALMFLGLVGLSTVICVTVPALAAMWKAEDEDLG